MEFIFLWDIAKGKRGKALLLTEIGSSNRDLSYLRGGREAVVGGRLEKRSRVIKVRVAEKWGRRGKKIHVGVFAARRPVKIGRKGCTVIPGSGGVIIFGFRRMQGESQERGRRSGKIKKPAMGLVF